MRARRRAWALVGWAGGWACLALLGPLSGALPLALADDPPGPVIPHAQDKPPGPALSPQEAIRKMTVPEGFSVELVAAEPDLVNPVAMTFDERGRVWVCESLEYPRREAGPGRDRVKVLEDTDGDGRADRFTVFAEGLNIPSGIAVGHGGVWVANAPDILFLQDTDGDGRADKSEVVVTGFGRTDTHELPNSLTWGPDGWLYGLNGVFNHSRVEYRGKVHEFTCALFRIHPRTRDFELFCEGTSNPWGVAFDGEGSAFVSACVIDHLWHLVESGYYHRQGGPYPPFTWKLGSIVQHKHQKAAYCGLHYFDSDVYPEPYRRRLYMGNIHGGCVNVDELARQGSSYFARPNEDFLTAHDAWFMPVAQKTGPDGCLYVLDWYDRYHCYQDANRDPQGIDRLRGRLYRVRYGESPRRHNFDLAKESDAALLKRLAHPSIYDRDIAQRLLAERGGAGERDKTGNVKVTAAAAKTQRALEDLVLNERADRLARTHALWARLGAGPLDDLFHVKQIESPDPFFRAWAVRAAGNMRKVSPAVAKRIASLVDDPSPDVRLQVVIAARKIEGIEAISLLLRALASAGDDRVIPQVIWQNLHPILDQDRAAVLSAMAALDGETQPWRDELWPIFVARLLSGDEAAPVQIAELLKAAHRQGDSAVALARVALSTVTARVQNGEIAGDRLAVFREALTPQLSVFLRGKEHPLRFEAALLMVSWKDPAGFAAVRAALGDARQPEARRLGAVRALVAAEDAGLLDSVTELLCDPKSGSLAWRGDVLASLGPFESDRVADVVLMAWSSLEAELRPRAVELLSSRASWARRLLAAMGEKTVPQGALNANQVQKLLALGDPELAEDVRVNWGALRTERDPDREAIVAEMRMLLRQTEGHAERGWTVYKKLCGQCHKLHGEGQEVGPDITVNGRNSFHQLLSNVFDPSLVIGPSYQARILVTGDGRVITGLPVEESQERISLKTQGGKVETIARSDVDEYEVSSLSMMPEGVERLLSRQEVADLFALLTLDKPPTDPAARRLPGTGEIAARETTIAAEFNEILGEVAPGFSIAASGERGVGLLPEFRGQRIVVRTHPPARGQPAVLRRSLQLPEEPHARLHLRVTHDERGDFRLVIRANGEEIHAGDVGPKSTKDGWLTLQLDLSRFAGERVELELENQPTGWSWEYAYWGEAVVRWEE